ncbi:hypothetical protein DYU05_16285 [Mucilaginibacter terrenus]|uniref:Uncharacterized protein n=1 Tax=Mucilaginibacter terrenus TaxID=2482727 RepID=A0A3E2NME2_9SPHI|nr:hypothetical protein [Mucilaginibacter terrenus]RFZ82177.1 hypothetical protein DYU05_16285 [Mucilaginibacter terrenus]
MYLLSVLTFFMLCGAPTAEAGKLTAATKTASIDTSRYAILKFHKGRDSFLFDSTYTAANTTEDDIKKIEKIIKVTVAEYNERLLKNTGSKATKAGLIYKPDKYYKQIICVINSKGEKTVWVNCFCTPHEKRYWQKGIVMVLDGGPCFFNIKINLVTNTVMDLQVNGVSPLAP